MAVGEEILSSQVVFSVLFPKSFFFFLFCFLQKTSDDTRCIKFLLAKTENFVLQLYCNYTDTRHLECREGFFIIISVEKWLKLLEYSSGHLRCVYLYSSHDSEEYKNIDFYGCSKTRLVFVRICAFIYRLLYTCLWPRTPPECGGCFRTSESGCGAPSDLGLYESTPEPLGSLMKVGALRNYEIQLLVCKRIDIFIITSQ